MTTMMIIMIGVYKQTGAEVILCGGRSVTMCVPPSAVSAPSAYTLKCTHVSIARVRKRARARTHTRTHAHCADDARARVAQQGLKGQPIIHE